MEGKMRYLIDTITYNTYFKLKTGGYDEKNHPPKQVNLVELENFNSFSNAF